MSTAEFLVLVAVVCIGFVIWKSKSSESKQKYPTPEETPADDIRKPDLTVSPDNAPAPHRSKDFANVEVPNEVVAEVSAAEAPSTEAVVTEAEKASTATEAVATVDTQPKVVDSATKPKSSRSNKRRRTKP